MKMESSVFLGRERNSSLELLRILCMFIIIIHHFCFHGIMAAMGPITSENYTWNFLVVQLLGWGSSLTNSVFILISGYYTISKKVKWNKIIRLIATMFFYSWLIAILFYGFGIENYSTKDIVKAFLPILFGYNWFVCCYIILFCFIPFINPFLNSLGQKSYLHLLLLTLVMYAIIPTFGGETFMGNAFTQFVFMYAIGGYIRLFGFNKQILHRDKFWKIAVVLVTSILILLIFGFNLIGYFYKINMFLKHSWYFVSLFSIFIAITLFMSFLTQRSFTNQAINAVAKSVLGIYLIHDNPIIRHFIWTELFPNIDYLYTKEFFLFMFVKVLSVFIICLVIDQLKIRFLDPLIEEWLNFHWTSWSLKIKEQINKL